jgi:cyclopropane-fatty-acyl-phospholipid synthase
MFTVKKGEGSFLARSLEQVLSSLCERYDGNPFEVRLWNGRKLRLGIGAPAFAVTFRTRRAFCETLLHNSLGLGEAYVRHEALFEGDLEDALTGLGAFYLRMRGTPGIGSVAQIRESALELFRNGRFLRVFPPAKEKTDALQSDEFGDDFCRSYLDKRVQYSWGYFRTPGDTLDEAQAQKIAYMMKKLSLRHGHRLLDIGCGFGHLMFHAAENYGVQCLGITTSESQARYIREQAQARRLPVEVRVMSYDELDEHVRWDRIISVDTMPHLGRHHMDLFYNKVKALLAPDAVCLLHTVAKMKESQGSDAFVRKHVHPGYWVPSLEGMTSRAAARGLCVLDTENLRRHYALTAHHFRQSLLQNYDRVKWAMGRDDAFMRTWDFYLAYSVAAFRTGHLNLIEMVLSSGLSDEYPMTRDFLYTTEAAPRERGTIGPSVHSSHSDVGAPS